jgi:ABC-type antimicrobial peptide transport system permease subunit
MSVTLQPAQVELDPNHSPNPFVWSVTPGYLDVIRGTMIRGRWIADRDVLGSEPVIVLSDETARVAFGAEDPIGRRVRLDGYERTVVGIVGATRFLGPEAQVGPEVFVPFLQGSYATAELLVRTDPEPQTLVPALHAAVRATLPDATSVAQLLEDDYARLLAQRKFNMVILVIFGVVAIVVAALGIYGLMAYLVEQRRREIGVRLALGAEPLGILRMVLNRATGLLVIGLAIGIAAAALLEGVVRAFLFEPQRFDPLVYGAAALALFAAGLIAAAGPARRAARVDPLVALRVE